MTIALPALFAALVAVAASVAIERWGGRLGGVLGSVPTTIVPAAAGLWMTAADMDAFVAAMGMVPVGSLLNAAFLWTWRALPPRLPPAPLPRQLAMMTALSLAVWLAGASLAVTASGWLRGQGVPPTTTGAAALLTAGAIGVWACWDAPPSPAGTRRVGPTILAARGALAAVAIATALTIARQGYPFIAGVASMFPAIFLTTMASLWASQGHAVPAGAAGPMMLGGTAVGAFALLTTRVYPLLGVGWGTLFCWVAAVGGVSVPVGAWLLRGGRPAPPAVTGTGP